MPAGDPATPTTSPGLPETVLQMTGPQLWWAYLAVLSGQALHVPRDCRRIVYVDSLDGLRDSRFADDAGTRHVLLFWDGVPPCGELPSDIADLCQRLRVTTLRVGTTQCEALPRVQEMFPDGELSFHPEQVRLARESSRRVLGAKLRNFVIPLKNVLRPSGSFAEAVQLLLGGPRVVFCGSFGLDRKVLGMLDNRYGHSPAAVRERVWANQRQHRSPEDYRVNFTADLHCLLQHYRQGNIAELYFVATVRLLDRDYLLQHLRSEEVPLYTNQFSRHFIDVYSTPFYRQHLFLDFGSTISDANYPRTADLAWYGKRTAKVDLPSDAAAIAAGIADGSHVALLEAASLRLSAEVRQDLRAGRA